MAKSLDQVKLEEATDQQSGETYREVDVKVATNIVLEALDGGGLKVIRDAINQSQDPAMVIGQLLAQIFGQVAESAEQEYNIPPGVFIAEGGVLDHVLNYIESELGYPEEFSDEIYAQVMETIKAGAHSPEAPNNVMAQEEPVPEEQAMGGMV